MVQMTATAPNPSHAASRIQALRIEKSLRSPGAKRVLIVEDDEDIIRGMNLRLRSHGYETLEAHDGQDGVDGAVAGQPDAIVMDVRMPHMNGLEALNRLQSLEATHAIPVIMLSASLADRQAALDAGARCFLRKPYQGDVLIAVLEEALHDQDDETLRIPTHA